MIIDNLKTVCFDLPRLSEDLDFDVEDFSDFN